MSIASDREASRNAGIPAHPSEASERIASNPEYEGDLQLLENSFDPTEAHLLQSCLQAGGVDAVLADANLVQTHSLLAVAVGGARLLVPAAQLAEARSVLAAFRRGDFAIDEDADVGQLADESSLGTKGDQ